MLKQKYKNIQKILSCVCMCMVTSIGRKRSKWLQTLIEWKDVYDLKAI